MATRAGPPLIADIRRNSLDDGPGVRSTVFFKGCVLACVWCQNPETLSTAAELQRNASACIGCGECVRVCPHGAVRLQAGARHHDRAVCRLCASCVAVCPGGALRLVGRAYGVDELVAELRRDEPFYRASGGGVTLSGGEPTMHLDFAAAVASRLHAGGIHVLLETCGLYRPEAFESSLLPALDAIYFDLKLVDDALHRRHTGASNRPILENLRRLAVPGLRERVLPRVPLVPGITDGDDNLTAVARLLRELGFARVALLPYNPLWVAKCRELGREPTYACERFMEEGEIEHCRQVVRKCGLELR